MILGILSAGLIIYAVNTTLNSQLIYGGLIGLVGTSILNTVYARRWEAVKSKARQNAIKISYHLPAMRFSKNRFVRLFFQNYFVWSLVSSLFQ